MIAVKALLAHLSRPDVVEVCVEAGKRPVARVGSAAQPIADEVVSADDLLQILFAAGGSRYLDTLAERPAQWRTRVEGVGVVVSAAMRNEVIEARFALRDPAPGAGAAAPPAPAPAPDPAPAKLARAKTHPEEELDARRKRGPRSGHGGSPSSRRVRAVKVRSSTPPPPPITPRGEPIDLEDPAANPHGAPTPRTHIAPPREALPSDPRETPAGDFEIDLDISATEIPSVPHPDPLSPLPPKVEPSPSPPPPPPLPRGLAHDFTLSEGPASGPPSPRTLPEARFSREPEPRPPARRASAARMEALQPSLDFDTPSEPFAQKPRPSEAPTPAPRSDEPISPVTSVPPPEGVRTVRPSARTTRPLMREPYTPLYRRLLRLAREAWASDLHLVADRAPMLRVAGQLVSRGEPIEAKVIEDMILSRVPGRLMASFEQEGSCDFALDEPELGRFRVNASRQRTGVKASFRLVSPNMPTLAQLGLPDIIAGATRHHQGLVVITGPAGHGKTATLAALVDMLNADTRRHILTLEDPIEHLYPKRRALLSQREIGAHVRSFQAGLKAALREDPDVIVVGELRDTETVRMALTASETGHLVLGTMSTPSAAKTIDRLVDLFPPADHAQVRATLAGGLKLIVGQRLLPNKEGTGMIAAAEVLPGMVPLWNLIRENRTYQIPSLQQRGRALGVIRLDDSLADLARAGKVTPGAAVAVAENPDELEQTLGIRRPNVAVMRQTAPVRPPEPAPSEPKTGEPKGLFERAGALFKKGT